MCALKCNQVDYRCNKTMLTNVDTIMVTQSGYKGQQGIMREVIFVCLHNGQVD